MNSMRNAPKLMFQVLTKRPERMRHYLKRLEMEALEWQLPLPNVWLGVSVENQRWADERIPILLDTPSAVRFVSYEPALAAVSFCPCGRGAVQSYEGPIQGCWFHGTPALDLVICGGEGGRISGR